MARASTPSPTVLTTPRRRAALGVLWSTARAGTRAGTPGIGERVRSLPALVRDSVTGRYPGFSRSRLAMSAIGLVYLVSPVDVLPEVFLPVVGLLDDGVVAAWIAGTLLVATEDYAAWRRR
ncbi:MAG: YkvA family protein [Janthinobacterium lividum]